MQLGIDNMANEIYKYKTIHIYIHIYVHTTLNVLI